MIEKINFDDFLTEEEKNMSNKEFEKYMELEDKKMEQKREDHRQEMIKMIENDQQEYDNFYHTKVKKIEMHREYIYRKEHNLLDVKGEE